MHTYAAVDLHSNNGFLAIIDETDRVLRQRKLPNKLELFVSELEPYRATLQGVAVESTFNWYWLVDGLQAKEFPVVLVNTSAIQQYSGLKHSDDQYDARWLAEWKKAGQWARRLYDRWSRAARYVSKTCPRSSPLYRRPVPDPCPLEQVVPGGKINAIGKIGDQVVYGSARTRIGITVIDGVTKVVRRMDDGKWRILGNFQ